MDAFTTNVVAVVSVLGVSGALVFGAQYLPPLTQPDASAFPEFQQYAPVNGEDAAMPSRQGSVPFHPAEVQSFCRSELSGVDCGCFADKASHVMRGSNPEVTGWGYADRWDLARAQGVSSCS